MPFQTKWGKYQVFCHSAEEYHLLREDVFVDQSYFFEAEQADPVIIDIGAHVGLSVVYFKNLYPSARIIAVEPVPTNLELLEHTIWTNQFENVEIVRLAITPDQVDELTLYSDTSHNWHSTASIHPGSWRGDQTSEPITVAAQNSRVFLLEMLAQYQRIDLLKLDVEGAEQLLLEECKTLWPQIQEIVFEFHPHPSQNLYKLYQQLSKQYSQITFSKNGKEVNQRLATGLVMVSAKN